MRTIPTSELALATGATHATASAFPPPDDPAWDHLRQELAELRDSHRNEWASDPKPPPPNRFASDLKPLVRGPNRPI
jgi:hypothetical protein